MEDERFYTVPEVAEKLRLSERTVWRMIKDERLEAFKLGGQYRISDSALDRFVESSRYKGKG